MIIKKGQNHFTFDKDLKDDYNILYDCEEKTKEDVTKDIIDNVIFVTDGCKEKYVWKQIKNEKVLCCVSKNIPRVLGEMEINNDKKRIYLRDLVKKNIKKIKVNNYDFFPTDPRKKINFNEPTFNTFNGFNIEFDNKFNVDEKLIKPILDHIKILSNFEEKSYEYIINWLSSIIQKPEKKTGVCPVFISDQGAGKTSFFEWISNEIIGKDWTLTISNNDNIFKNFNSELNNKLFTILDEAQLDGNYKKKADQLKSLITQQYIRIEYKGIDPVVMNDRNNYVILTNNDFPVKVEQTDRRFAVFNVSNDNIGDDIYFTNLNKAFDNDIIKKHFFHYLLYNNINDFHAERDIPKTKAKIDLKKESSPSPVKFAIDILKNGIKDNSFCLDIPIFEDNDKFNTEKLYNEYKNFMTNKCPNERILVENGFVTQLNKLLKIKTSKKGKEKNTIINRNILKESVCNYFNVDNIEEIYITDFEYSDSGIESDENINDKKMENLDIYIDKGINVCMVDGCNKKKHNIGGLLTNKCMNHLRN